MQVTVTLTQAQKEALEERFVNGAYVEGFCLCPAASNRRRRGGDGPLHPRAGLLWQLVRSSMFEKGTYIDGLYGRNPTPMYYHQESPNYVGLKYDGDRVQYKYAESLLCGGDLS